MTGISGHDNTPAGRFSAAPPTEKHPATVKAAGEIDLANVEQFRAVLTQAASTTDRTLTIDMSEVTYCDSTGIQALFTVANSHDLTLIIPVRGPLSTLLRITGLDRVATVTKIQ